MRRLGVCIVIRNIGGDPLGICEYEVRINEKRITTFRHSRPEGLSKCLSEASRAVARQGWLDAAKVMGIDA